MDIRRLVKFTVNIVGWLVGISFLVLFWQQITNNGVDWNHTISTIDWGRFVLALLILFIGMGIRSQLSYISQANLEYSFSRIQAYKAWFLSQLGKYIPGGILLYAARAVFYKRSGMSAVLATMVIAWEMIAIVGTGLLFGLTSIVFLDNHDWSLLIMGGSLFLLSCFICSLMLWPWRLLAQIPIVGTGRFLQIMTNLGNRRFRLIARLSTLAFITWLIIGIGFYVLIASLLDPDALPLWYAIVTYVVAWTVGFLVVVSPAGLGPREAVITLMLVPYYGNTQAFSIALLARIWWTFAEAIHILLASAVQVSSTYGKLAR